VSSSTPQLVDATELTTTLGISLDAELVVLAFTHRSYAYENGGLPTNERLEFLGDAVLGLCVTDALYRAHPDFSEGQLAKLRASIVNMHALAGVGRAIGLGTLLRLGKGEELTDGRNKPSLLADAVEALLGAIYFQHGLEAARGVIHQLFGALIAAAPSVGAGLDWKTSLQERTATLGLGVPSYRLSEEGPDHAKQFTATVIVSGEDRGIGQGRTKKEAEQKAAALAYGILTPTPADSAALGADTVAADAATPAVGLPVDGQFDIAAVESTSGGVPAPEGSVVSR
jgi:ribonuclease-3